MTRRWLGLIVAAGALGGGGVIAGEYGTRAEAQALLERVVTDMKKDEPGTLARITQKAYNDRDLYPFCSGGDGRISAHGAIPSRVGQDQATLKDSAGKAFGAEIRKVAQAGRIDEVSYMYSRPGSGEQEPKVSLVTKVGQQVCGVGYYKEKATAR